MRWLFMVMIACSSAPPEDDYCPNASCIVSICECGSDSCAGIAPEACGSGCGSGKQCTNDIDDTEQCSVTCNADGTGCPAGYFCQTFIP